MLPHYLWVLKLPGVLWQLWSQETQPFQPKNLRHLPLILIISPEYWSKLLKEKDKWLKITTVLENSILKVYHQLQEVYHKSKYPLISMKMVFWTFLLRKNPLEKLIISKSQIIKEDFPKKKSKDLLKKPKNTKTKMKLSERRLKPKTT